MGCKPLNSYFFTTLTHFSVVGSDGCIANSATLVTASQAVFDKLWTNYQRRSMGRMNVHWEKSKMRTGNLPDGYSYALPQLPDRSVLRSWQNFLHLTSRQDKFRNFARIGTSKIRWKLYFRHVPHCSPLLMSMIPWSYNSRTSR